MVKCWNKLHKEVVELLSFQILKTWLDGAWSNVI